MTYGSDPCATHYTTAPHKTRILTDTPVKNEIALRQQQKVQKGHKNVEKKKKTPKSIEKVLMKKKKKKKGRLRSRSTLRSSKVVVKQPSPVSIQKSRRRIIIWYGRWWLLVYLLSRTVVRVENNRELDSLQVHTMGAQWLRGTQQNSKTFCLWALLFKSVLNVGVWLEE